MLTAKTIQSRLRGLADSRDAKNLQWYFKTGPGEYGEGDVFAGIRVPALRKLVPEFQAANARVLHALLASRIHEERLLALLIMVRRFERGDESVRERLYRFYLSHTGRINNWDLVDLSAPTIVGGWLADKDRAPLRRLARSAALWERRIAVLATFAFIRRGEFDDALAVADRLLADRSDLIHKAVGWMLREVGKRDVAVEEAFLRPRCRTMPRTMLRYAIERFPETKRQAYLRGTV